MNVPIDISKTVLETDRLILRSWKKSDLDALHEYAKIKDVGHSAGFHPHASKHESMTVLNMFIEGRRTFALELKQNHKAIGSLGLDEISHDLGEPYSGMRGCEIGYALSKDYWGSGLMTEAVRCAVEYCFTEVGCDFLQLYHISTNLRSQRVAQKCGFRFVKKADIKELTGTIRPIKIYILERETEKMM